MIAITESEMRVVLGEEIAALDELTRPTWKKYKVPLHEVSYERNGETGSFFAVARKGDEVIVFDNLSEQFATGTIEDGVLREWESYGAPLSAALKHFPRRARNRSE